MTTVSIGTNVSGATKIYLFNELWKSYPDKTVNKQKPRYYLLEKKTIDIEFQAWKQAIDILEMFVVKKNATF